MRAFRGTLVAVAVDVAADVDVDAEEVVGLVVDTVFVGDEVVDVSDNDDDVVVVDVSWGGGDAVLISVAVGKDSAVGEESSKTIPFIVATVSRAASVCDGRSSNCIGRSRRALLETEISLIDTSSFCVVHETLFLLKRAIMVTGSRRILNVSWESWNNCGKSLPIVAVFDVEPPSISVVVQLLSPALVH